MFLYLDGMTNVFLIHQYPPNKCNKTVQTQLSGDYEVKYEHQIFNTSLHAIYSRIGVSKVAILNLWFWICFISSPECRTIDIRKIWN